MTEENKDKTAAAKNEQQDQQKGPFSALDHQSDPIQESRTEDKPGEYNIGTRAVVSTVEYDTWLQQTSMWTDYAANLVRVFARADLTLAATATRLTEGSLTLTALSDSFSAGIRSSFSVTSSYNLNVGLLPYAPVLSILGNPLGALTAGLLVGTAGVFPFLGAAISNLTQQWSLEFTRSFSLKTGTSFSVNNSATHNWGLGPTFNYCSGPSHDVMSSNKKELVAGTYEVMTCDAATAATYRPELGVGGPMLAAMNGLRMQAYFASAPLPRIAMNAGSVLMRAGPLGVGAGVEVDMLQNVHISAGPLVAITASATGIVLRAGPNSLEITPTGINIISAGAISLGTVAGVEISSAAAGLNVQGPAGISSATTVRAGIDVMAGPTGASLLTHFHTSTAPGSPTTPPMPMPAVAVVPVPLVPPLPPVLILPPVGTTQDAINQANAAQAQAQNTAAAAT